jgi:ankyrin repeat protein
VLHAAAEHGHAALIPALVAWPGIDVNAEDADGWTALHQAAAEGHAAVVWTLAAVPDFNVNAKVGGDSGTAVHIAAEYGRVEAVQALAAVPDFDVNAKEEDDRTALHTAAAAGEAAVVEVLIAMPGIKVNARDGCNCTALHLAAKCGHAAVVQLLLAVPVIDIDVRDNMGATPLVSANGSARFPSAKGPDYQQIQRALERHRAPEAAVSSAIRELLQRLCSSDAPPRSQAASTTSNAVATSTSASASVANPEVMQGIVDSLHSGRCAAAEVPARLRSIGGFPQQMQERIAQSLALGFFCGHYRNADGSIDAAIERALNDTGLQHPYAEAIKTLAAVPNINLCHVDGINLLGIAAQQGNARMIRTLVRLGALVNLPSPNGATALAIAVGHRQWGACAELIAHGALPMLPDASGFPVLYHIVADFCSDAHCSAALALLIRYIRLKGISFDIPVRNPDEAARAKHPTVLLSDLLANALMRNPELLVRYGHLLLFGAPEQPQAATLRH